jgi:hypothetical protein
MSYFIEQSDKEMATMAVRTKLKTSILLIPTFIVIQTASHVDKKEVSRGSSSS